MRAELVEFAEIAPGIRHFVFRTPELERVEFVPGQFVSLSAVVKGKHITRAYSLASPPKQDNTFEVCLNRVDDGAFSPYLFSMKPGDSIEMRAPLGGFVLREPLRESVFIATGTGIAPFRSMLPVALKAPHQPRITLIFGVRYESLLLYGGEFRRMAGHFPQFRFWPTLTQPGPEWTGRSGRVQAHLPEAVTTTSGAIDLDLDVYLCGMKIMVDEVRNLLKNLGYDRKQIRSEKYD
jgi:ferredoxin-NADP reductase